jgi:hypothetical protein
MKLRGPARQNTFIFKKMKMSITVETQHPIEEKESQIIF